MKNVKLTLDSNFNLNQKLKFAHITNRDDWTLAPGYEKFTTKIQTGIVTRISEGEYDLLIEITLDNGQITKYTRWRLINQINAAIS